MLAVAAALLLAGCGGTSTASKYLDQQESQNPKLIGQTCVEISSARQTGTLFSYYHSFKVSYEQALAGAEGAPSAKALFAEIERRCKNPAR